MTFKDFLNLRKGDIVVVSTAGSDKNKKGIVLDKKESSIGVVLICLVDPNERFKNNQMERWINYKKLKLEKDIQKDYYLILKASNKLEAMSVLEEALRLLRLVDEDEEIELKFKKKGDIHHDITVTGIQTI